MYDGKNIVGALVLETNHRLAYSRRDILWAESLVKHMTVYRRSVLLSIEIQNLARFRSSLTVVTRIAHSSLLSLDIGLRLFLTGITANEGLGFSRAMLFLRDGTGTALRGKIAIGPQTRQEAVATWDNLATNAENHRPPSERLTTLLAAAKAYGAAISEGKADDAALSRTIKTVTWTPNQESDAVALCLSTNRQVTIPAGQENPARALLSQCSAEDSGSAFVCTPIRSEEVTGCLIADYRFLESEAAIPQGAIDTLESYAEHITLFIDNHRLRRRAEAASYSLLSHQIRGPLSNAYHKSVQLASATTLPSPIRELALGVRMEIAATVAITKKVSLCANLSSDGDLRIHVRPLPHAQLMEALTSLEEGFAARTNPALGLTFRVDSVTFSTPNYLHAKCDLVLFEQALFNILDNAAKYSKKNSHIRIYGTREEGTWGVYVSNRGLPLSSSDADRCMRRNWRSRSASSTNSEGLGLGLWLVDYIMRGHNGQLQVTPTDADGITTFGLVFPCATYEIN